jgi:hypothetical protein
MTKKTDIKKIERDGDIFVMTVRLGGTTENWTYVREEVGGLVTYAMIGRE